jgi:hypothetical protein
MHSPVLMDQCDRHFASASLVVQGAQHASRHDVLHVQCDIVGMVAIEWAPHPSKVRARNRQDRFSGCGKTAASLPENRTTAATA